MSWKYCTSASAIAKAGVHASSTIAYTTAAAILDQWSNEVEGKINVETNTDWSGSYTSLCTGIRGLLADVASSLVAMRMISYDTTGYLSREADVLLNVNDDIVNKGIKALDGKSNTLKTP